MKHLFGLLALAALASAKAEPCLSAAGAHLASWHARPGFEAATVGIYVRSCDGLTAGALRNSEGRASAYLAQTWSTSSGRWSITAGGITGYRSSAVIPLLVPSLAVPISQRAAMRLAFLPRVHTDGSSAVHLSIEFQLQP